MDLSNGSKQGTMGARGQVSRSILYRNNHLQRRQENRTVGGYINMYCRIWAHTSRLNSIIWFGGEVWEVTFYQIFSRGGVGFWGREFILQRRVLIWGVALGIVELTYIPGPRPTRRPTRRTTKTDEYISVHNSFNTYPLHWPIIVLMCGQLYPLQLSGGLSVSGTEERQYI